MKDAHRINRINREGGSKLLVECPQLVSRCKVQVQVVCLQHIFTEAARWTSSQSVAVQLTTT